MTAAGQTINDRILAARHSIAGQGLAKAVCKATTEEIIGPKKKHLDYLLHCTNEPNVSIPTLANLLIERTQNPNWVVVFKGLITTHHMMCYGNERFTQYLASSNSNFQLGNYLDKSGVQGYDMSPFIRRYAKYMSEKAVSYRTVAFDFCKVKRGKDGGTLRTMSADKLVKTLPTLQAQVDALLEFDCTSQDLNNGVINACFMLLFRDLIRLFACYNDGIINLLEKYFEMQKKMARDALDIYKKFLIRMDRVADFLKVAENVGIDKGDIPDLAKAPSSLLEALEAHLASIEGRKPGSGGTTPTGNNRVNVAAAVSALSTTSNAFGTAAAANGGVIDEKLAEKLLEEEAAAMEKFRSTASASNPFAQAEPETAEETPNILDLFGVPAPATAAVTAAPVAAAAPAPAYNDGKASDDLLQLAGNPFANMLNAAGSGAPVFPAATQPAAMPATSAGFGNSSSPFASDNSFNNFFGQPAAPGVNGNSGANLFGEVLQPAGGTAGNANKPKVITGDLDSSLANLASNLNFGPGGKSNVTAPARGPPMAGINNFQNQQQQQMVPGLMSPTKPNPSIELLSPGGGGYSTGFGGNTSSLVGNASSMSGNASGVSAFSSDWTSPSPALFPASSQPSPFQPSPSSNNPFPASSSPFISSSQSFPSNAFPSLMTPSPSMPGAVGSSTLATPEPLNTGFLSLSGGPASNSQAFTVNNNNNNNINKLDFGKFASTSATSPGASLFGGDNFGQAATTAAPPPASAHDPFAGLL